jgi:hypothetical protein
MHLLPATGQETGIDLGLESFAALADGTMIHNPRCYRKAKGICGAASGGSLDARRGAAVGARRSSCWPKRINTFATSDATSSTRKPATCYKHTT